MEEGADSTKPVAPIVAVSKEVYKDAVAPIAKQTGKALETVGLAINAVLSPLRKRAILADQLDKDFEANLAEKLKGVDAASIQAPLGSVAIPALEGVSRVWDEPELREMYMNLIANSVVTEKQQRAHPAFVTAIQSMSTADAKLFRHIITSYVWRCSYQDTYQLIAVEQEGSSELAETIQDLPSFGELNIYNIQERLKLIEPTYSPVSQAYIEQHNLVLLHFRSCVFGERTDEAIYSAHLSIDMELLVPTAWGRQFACACLPVEDIQLMQAQSILWEEVIREP